MNRKIIASFLIVLAAALSGCATVKARIVTAEHWHNNNTFYVAYSETDGTSVTANLRKCNISDDNQVACEEQQEVNTLLNPPD